MSGTSAAAATTGTPLPLLAKLLAAVRVEFRCELYVPDPADPVLGGGDCTVAGCSRLRSCRGLCRSHYACWVGDGRPELDAFTASAPPLRGGGRRKDEVYDLRSLTPQLRLELGYALQCRHDERASRLHPAAFNQVVAVLAGAGAASLAERDLPQWIELLRARGWSQTASAIGFLRYAWIHVDDLSFGADAETEYARDVWSARRLGLVMQPGQGHYSVRFDGIPQPWLRDLVKRWARYELSRGHAFPTVRNQANALRWFATFLQVNQPGAADAAGITRQVVETYLGWLASGGLEAHTRMRYLIYLRAFLEQCRRHGWLHELSAAATLYADDLPRPERALPRFIPEFVMAQLESQAALEQIADPTTRHLVVLLMETGLRTADACALAFNPVVDDSVGWPCLRFLNHKVRTEQLVPLSPRAAEAIAAQQAHLRSRWPDAPPPWLFPRPHANPDGTRPFAYGTLERRLARWVQAIGVVDEAGCPVTITLHRFRHTLGTRLINSGVPQHVVQKLLGHTSPQMTAVYAHLHDTTVREAFDEYCRKRVNVAGEALRFDPSAPTADAEWVKHNLARVQASLPNGYCGRPPQQDCPHPNACLTCPDFQTTPEFLPIHRRQAEANRVLIATAEANGQFRLAANHRRVQDNLERIIPALESIEGNIGGANAS